MRFRLIGLLFSLALPLTPFAQLSFYEGPAIWMPLEGAEERFSYAENDTLRVPQGEYHWKCSRELTGRGRYELVSIRAAFQDGQAEGPLELLRYTVAFAIDDFGLDGIRASTMGEKTLLRGQFAAGRPTGEWLVEASPLHEPQALSRLALQLPARRLSYRSPALALEGGFDAAGYFHGDWRWVQEAADTLSYRYRAGILESYARNGQAEFEALLDRENRSWNLTDSLSPAPAESRWVWSPGFFQIDTLAELQQPAAIGMDQALRPYEQGALHLSSHPLLDPPLLIGAARFYHPLGDSERELLSQADAVILALDSSLAAVLQLPVFQLRRAGDPATDRLMSEAEALQEQGDTLRGALRAFAAEEARFRSPAYLAPPATFGLRSHREYAQMLAAQADSLDGQAAEMLQRLVEKKEILRLRGAIEELEEEWQYMQDAMRQAVSAADTSLRFVHEAYARFVRQDHERRTAIYGALEQLHERQDFVREALEYNQYFYDFFREKRYEAALQIEDYLMGHYTQYLYNPYMAENNIRVVVKPRLLQAVLDDYWPYLLDEMLQATDGQEFQARFADALLLREVLRRLAYDKSPAARKLNRKGRKESSMPALEAMLRAYGREGEARSASGD